jgi:sulfur carrier protein
MIRVSINGTPRSEAPGTTVTGLVAEWCPSPRGIAVAVNGEVVPRSSWDTTLVDSGDRIEIVTAVAGG